MERLREFADAMAIFTDGFVYENHLGELRLLEKTILAARTCYQRGEFRYGRGERGQYLRRRWRRDAQNILTLGITLERGGV